MFRRKSATQTKNLLEYLASAEQERQQMRKGLIAQTAAVDEKNADLATKRTKLVNLLKGALAQDSFIDLDSLKKTPRISAFNRKRPERRRYLPKPLSGFGSLMPWKKKAYERQYEAAEANFRKDRHDFMAALNEHQRKVDQEQAEVEAHNEEIERYKQDFAAGNPTEIENYFTLVLEKSAYPAGFPKQAEVNFAAESETLRIDFALPAIDIIPGAKSYAYDSIGDEITDAKMPQKQRARLYSLVLAQISLRTVHEVFTADRANKTGSVVFEGYVDGINPSTGQPGRFCLVALKITRQEFDSLDLRQVEPRACLKGLNARLSSKPDQLLTVTPIAQDDYQDETVSAGTDVLYLKQQISELEGAIQTQSAQITESKSKLEAQRDRIAELVPELREAQERNAELQVEFQGQKDYIAELESRLDAQDNDYAELEAKLTEALDDTQPGEAITEFAAGNEFSEAAIFAPIVGETEDDGSGARIPRREGEAEANKEIAKPNLFEVMSVFVEAKGRYVDYIGESLPKEQINRLVREGRLERHRFHTYKLRATPAGYIWYKERSKQQGLPKRATEENLADAAQVPKKTATLRSLLLGEADDPVDAANVADGSASDPVDNDEPSGLGTSATVPPNLAERESLIEIIGRPQGDSARLLALMMESGWRSNRENLQPAFPDEFVNVIVDEINERAFDSIGENLIYEEGGLLIGHEEYCQDLETIFALPVYQHLRHR